MSPSLPSWERGLKLATKRTPVIVLSSLPSWERGLKQGSLGGCRWNIPLSLPSWERGLKQIVVGQRRAHLLVAPLVGAWIETTSRATS